MLCLGFGPFLGYDPTGTPGSAVTAGRLVTEFLGGGFVGGNKADQPWRVGLESAALGCARPPARVSKKEAVTAGFRRKKQYHLEVETTSLASYLTVGFRRKKQYHLEVEPTLWRLQMNYIEKTML